MVVSVKKLSINAVFCVGKKFVFEVISVRCVEGFKGVGNMGDRCVLMMRHPCCVNGFV